MKERIDVTIRELNDMSLIELKAKLICTQNPLVLLRTKQHNIKPRKKKKSL